MRQGIVSPPGASTLPSHGFHPEAGRLNEPGPSAQPSGPGPSGQRARFSIGAGVGLAAICLTVWLTGLRTALHGVVLTAGAVALLPFITLTGAVLVLCGAAALGAVAGGPDIFAAGAADGVTTGGGKLIRHYYGLLWRMRRHALIWGLGAGLGLGAAVLALVLWFFVVPREAETLTALLDAKARIDASKTPSAGLDPPVLDAFGRPVEFRRDGSWLTASYVLISRGFDGKESADDICVTGHSRAGALLDQARHPVETLVALRKGGVGAAARAQAVRDTRCKELKR